MLDPRAAGVMYEDPDGFALFLRRAGQDHSGEWCFPGGMIEEGEGARQAARREFHEEAGAAIFLPLRHADLRDGFQTFRAKGQRFAPRLNEEHSAFVWARPGQAPQPLHPGVRATLKELGL